MAQTSTWARVTLLSTYIQCLSVEHVQNYSKCGLCSCDLKDVYS